MNKNILIGPVAFLGAYIGFDLIQGRELQFDKVIVGVLLAIIIGLYTYIQEMKKKKK